MKKYVRVFVKDGIVQHVDAPWGVIVKIMDYDIDAIDVEKRKLHRDKMGDQYFQYVWTIKGKRKESYEEK